MRARQFAPLLAGCVLWAATPAAAQIITTVAGGGPNNLPALEVGLGGPSKVAIDASGNLYIAASALNAVLRVDAVTGILTKVAGTGVGGFSGDGGPATLASLRVPSGVALDSAGNLFIADQVNARIRRVDAVTGVITTVAGNGTQGFNGDGLLATGARLNTPVDLAVDAAGNIFIADQENHRIRRVDAATGIITTVAGNGTQGFSGDSGPATGASLRYPIGVAVDAVGSVFISDWANQRIRRVDAATSIITTVAGNGTAGFSGDSGPATSASLRFPAGVAVDSAGHLFVADSNNARVRRVDAVAGIITTVAGNGTIAFSGDSGPATSASLVVPMGVAVTPAGHLFIADLSNSRIRRVDAASGVITTAAGNGTFRFGGDTAPATSASLLNPFGVAVDAVGNLFIVDRDNQRIRRVDAASGVIATVAGNGAQGYSGDGGPATGASLFTPMGAAADAAGHLFIADRDNHRVRRIDAATGVITTVAGNGIDSYGGDGGPATSASLRRPSGVALDAAGNLFIADTFNARIRRVDAATGTITTVAGSGISGFSGDSGPAVSARLQDPNGLAIDASGHLFIADRGNHRIRRVDAATGIITTVAGSGGFGFSGDNGPALNANLRSPTGVAVDAAGHLFIVDAGNHRVRRVDAVTAVITTVAGSGEFGFGGDNGPATAASLAGPWGIAVDVIGNLFIADVNNHRIRAVWAPQIASTTLSVAAATGFYGGTVDLQATLTSNPPVPNRTVVFTLNGEPVGSASTDSNGVATLAGVSLAGLNAGTYAAAIAATFGGDESYEPSAGLADLTVAPAAPQIAWMPASIMQGTPLGAAQLNATASFNGNPIAGTFVYDPPAGTVLAPGTHLLGLTFTPSSANFTSPIVQQAQLIVEADTTAPVLTLPSNLQVVATSAAGAVVTFAASAVDLVDGVIAAVCEPTSGSTFAIGTTTVNCTASDAAGNSTSGSFTVAVHYNVCLLYDTTRVHQRNSTVPLRLRLCTATGENLSSPGVTVTATMLVFTSNDTQGVLDDAGSSNSDGNFRYDAALGGYIFNLKTTGLSSGTWEVRFAAGSGGTGAAPFKIR